MLGKLEVFPNDKGEPKVAPPVGWIAVAGEPVAQAWRCYMSSDGKKISGLWKCSQGTFRVAYDKWEFCHLLAGSCEITPDNGSPVIVKAGDAFVLERGFEGTWKVIEDTEKHFVFIAD